jgi:DHA2 family multidrug resistance protein
MQQLWARARNNGETHPWAVAATVMLPVFMEVLDTSVANVSLPHIAGDISAGVDESTWILTSYLVSNAIILPLTGWFSSICGRKRFYLSCVALFTLSSLLCGLSHSLGLLVFFRILQGVGGGAMQPISQAILLESFPREKRGMAMALFGIGVVFAWAAGLRTTTAGTGSSSSTFRWVSFLSS